MSSDEALKHEEDIDDSVVSEIQEKQRREHSQEKNASQIHLKK